MNSDTIVDLTCQGVRIDVFRTEHSELGVTLKRACDPEDEGPSQDLFIDPVTLAVSGIVDSRQMERTKAVQLAERTASAIEAGYTTAFVFACLDAANRLVNTGTRPDGGVCDFTVELWELLS
jgi:hypothetical protein